jgi:hypothetical protein
MRDDDMDRLANEVRALPTREKIAMARELLDATAKMHAAVKRQMVAAILRLAADDVEAGR